MCRGQWGHSGYWWRLKVLSWADGKRTCWEIRPWLRLQRQTLFLETDTWMEEGRIDVNGYSSDVKSACTGQITESQATFHFMCAVGSFFSCLESGHLPLSLSVCLFFFLVEIASCIVTAADERAPAISFLCAFIQVQSWKNLQIWFATHSTLLSLPLLSSFALTARGTTTRPGHSHGRPM